MAVTHADLSIDRSRSDHGGKLGVFLIVFCILCGLSCFILSLLAEAMRSEATWILLTGSDDNGQKYGCVYSGSGKATLFCALGAFMALACAMVMKHAYVLLAVSKPTPHALISWGPDSGSSSTALTWQACFFFLSTWICFAVGEVLLMIGIGVESGHLRSWSTPKPSCLVNRPGLFAAAGVFGLTTVFLAAGLYLTALRAQRVQQSEASVRREVLEASYLYASPARSPRHHIPTSSRGNTRAMQEQADRPARDNPSATDKPSNAV